jgi:hypothetical protein
MRNIVYFIIFKWNIERRQIFIFEVVQYTLYQYFLSACKYKDILHDYFPLKLIGKYLLRYNKCGHRNVLSTRQVWMSIFHMINLKKRNSWTQGIIIFA